MLSIVRPILIQRLEDELDPLSYKCDRRQEDKVQKTAALENALKPANCYHTEISITESRQTSMEGNNKQMKVKNQIVKENNFSRLY